ncbi:MAG: hypothetical protein M3460_05960 [Actinomycetota bacterium]|nr:hypothetical protein [Actinomycetota bacterium]
MSTPGSHARNRDGHSAASGDRAALWGSAESGPGCAGELSGTPGMVLRHQKFLPTGGAHRRGHPMATTSAAATYPQAVFICTQPVDAALADLVPTVSDHEPDADLQPTP